MKVDPPTSVNTAADPSDTDTGRATSAKLEQQLVGVPFEQFKNSIRTNHRTVENDVSYANSSLSSTSPQLQVWYSSSALRAAFGNLKQLDLIVRHDHNCVLLTSFIEACPLLETFKLKFTLAQVSRTNLYVTDHSRAEAAKLKHAHKKLKAIEYVGVLVDSESSVKLALCLTEQALFLETFCFEFCFLGHTGERHLCHGDWYADKLPIYSEAPESLAGKIRRIKPVDIIIMCD